MMLNTLIKLVKFVKSMLRQFRIKKANLRVKLHLLSLQFNKFVKAHYKCYLKSYSQDGEDVVLNSFYEKSPKYKGFYVDIGAFDPFRFSNTQLFYDKGWKGLNIDATPSSMNRFKKYRKRDINLELAISDSVQNLTYYSFEEPALNTFNEEIANERINSGWKLKAKFDVQTTSINAILEKYKSHFDCIDFINIDVEGEELKILQQFDFDKFAPKYFLIEELDYIESDFSSHNESEISKLLALKGYKVCAKTKRTVIYKNVDFFLKQLPVYKNSEDLSLENIKYVKDVIGVDKY